MTMQPEHSCNMVFIGESKNDMIMYFDKPMFGKISHSTSKKKY